MIEQIFAWWPIVWTARVTSLIILATVSLTTFLFFARFCRPRHFIDMIRAPLPQIREIGGEAFGKRFAVELNAAQDAQLTALETRIDELEQLQRQDRTILERLARHTFTPKGQHGNFD